MTRLLKSVNWTSNTRDDGSQPPAIPVPEDPVPLASWTPVLIYTNTYT